MRTAWTRVALVAVGAILLFAGVVAGSAAGTLMGPAIVEVGSENNGGPAVTEFRGNGETVLRVSQGGSGTAIRAVSNSGAGVFTEARHRDRTGLFARNLAGSGGSGSALRAEGGANVGIRAGSDESAGIWTEGPDVALYASGNTLVTGDAYVAGTCTGCTLAVIVVNASDRQLAHGEAVTLAGLTGSRSQAMMTVVPAAADDPVIGIVQAAMVEERGPIGGDANAAYFRAIAGPIAPGGLARVITFGAAMAALVDDSGGEIQVGDRLGPSVTPGTLARLAPNGTSSAFAGYALTGAEDGVVALFVSPR